MDRNYKKMNELSVEARKPKLIYECFDYIIEEIPLNYRATIKCAMNPKEEWRGLDRDYYTHPEHGLKHAKEIVEYQIKLYFLSGVKKKEIPEHLKKIHLK